jgi:hypothetical protein
MNYGEWTEDSNEVMRQQEGVALQMIRERKSVGDQDPPALVKPHGEDENSPELKREGGNEQGND